MNYLRTQLSRPSGWIGRALGPFWNRRNQALNEAALARLALGPNECILEVGFGGGFLLDQLRRCLPDSLLAGADWSAEMAAAAARRLGPSVRLARASVQALPYPHGCFTRIVSVNSIFYWPDAPGALAELGRVTAPGGRLVLVFTARASLQQRGFARQGMGLYDGDEVGCWLRDAGYDAITVEQSADRHRAFWIIVAKK